MIWTVSLAARPFSVASQDRFSTISSLEVSGSRTRYELPLVGQSGSGVGVDLQEFSVSGATSRRGDFTKPGMVQWGTRGAVGRSFSSRFGPLLPEAGGTDL